jgi:hypothetical protein
MDRFLDQLRLHPWTAILAGAVLLEGLLLVGFKRTERAARLPKFLGLALLAGSVGAASSIRGVLDTFQAIALTGSGGYGTVAAGLEESQGAFLLGLVPALLTLVAGLLVARELEAGSPQTAEPRREPRLMSRWFLISLTLLSVLAVALSFHEIWFVQTVAAITLTPPSGNTPPAGSIGETAQSLSNHIVGLSLLSQAAVLGSAALILALYLSGTRAISPRQTRWGRTLAALLLISCLIGAVVVWRQVARFHEIAVTGMPR